MEGLRALLHNLKRGDLTMTMNKRDWTFFNSLTEDAQVYGKANIKTLAGNLKINRMSKENSKLKPSDTTRLLIWSMTPIKTCLNCESCKHDCYALKAYCQYPDVRNAWDINTELATNHLGLLEQLLRYQIKNEVRLAIKQGKDLTVRIHESGDFFSQDYLDMWSRIAQDYQRNVYFYGYTKSDKLLDFSRTPSNMNIVSSFVNGELLNFGSEAYVDKLVEDFNAFKCPAGAGTDVKCIRDCDYCVKGSCPVFVAH